LVFKTFRPFFPTIEKTASFYAPYMEEMTGMWKNPHERRKNGSQKYRIQLLAEAKQS